MKKLLFVCVAFAASLLFTNTTQAQAIKIGYFDEEQVLYAFPDMGKIDTALNSFRNDSLGAEYDYRYREFMKADSSFKKDSATLAPKARELAQRELLQKRYVLANWQQYGQEMIQAKTEQLLGPNRKKVIDALTAIVNEQKYTLVLNASALYPMVNPPLADNLTIRVALRLKLPVSKEIEDAFKAATGAAPKPGGVKLN